MFSNNCISKKGFVSFLEFFTGTCHSDLTQSHGFIYNMCAHSSLTPPAHRFPLTLQLVYPAVYSTAPLDISDIICPNWISYPPQTENSKTCSILHVSFFINGKSVLPFAQSRNVKLILDFSSASHLWTNLTTFKIYLASDSFSWPLLCFYPGPSHLYSLYRWFLPASIVACLHSLFSLAWMTY